MSKLCGKNVFFPSHSWFEEGQVVWGLYPAVLRAYTWLDAPGSLLVTLGVPYGLLGIEYWLAVCKASTYLLYYLSDPCECVCFGCTSGSAWTTQLNAWGLLPVVVEGHSLWCSGDHVKPRIESSPPACKAYTPALWTMPRLLLTVL